MPVFDELFDNNWKFVIAHRKVFITSNIDETTVYFDSRVPTHDEIMECNNIIMTGETERDPQLVQLALVQTKEEEESRKICDIVRSSKVGDLETYIIMGSIGDVFVERSMTEKLFANINVRDVKVNVTESNTRHSIIMPA